MHPAVPIDRGSGWSPGGLGSGARGLRSALQLWAALAIVAGVAARVLAARGDLWLDELWSLLAAREAGTFLGVFTKLHHDNNHHLNTLWMMAIGEGASPVAYRLLSVASASATLVLLAVTPIHGGREESVATTTLAAFSYLLVHYGSEARGYAPAMFFGVLAVHALQRYLRTRRMPWAGVYAAAATLGLLSHLTFMFVLAGATAWAGVELARTRRERPPGVASAALLAAPLAAGLALWAVDLRHMVIGGGPPWTLASVLRELSRTALGLPPGPLELLAVPAGCVAAYELAILVRARDTRAVFFAVTLLAPGALLVAQPPEYLAARYFVVAVPFLLMLVGAGLGALARRSAGGLAAALLVLALFTATNARDIARLLRFGRGDYRGTLALILHETPGRIATVGSDNDFRNSIVLQDQVRRMGAVGRVQYVPLDRWSRESPEWVLVHDQSVPAHPDPLLFGPNGRTYRLVTVFPYAGLSGWNWLVYRMSGAEPASAR